MTLNTEAINDTLIDSIPSTTSFKQEGDIVYHKEHKFILHHGCHQSQSISPFAASLPFRRPSSSSPSSWSSSSSWPASSSARSCSDSGPPHPPTRLPSSLKAW